MLDRHLETNARNLREVRHPPRSSADIHELTPTGIEPLDRTFLEGTSPVDLVKLATHTATQAGDFLRSYGYNPECPQELARLREVHQEAVDFLQTHLCPGPRPCDANFILPLEVQEPGDITNLFLWASSSSCQEPLQPWACAVLRVVHAIIYANQVATRPHSTEIRRQILDPYRNHIHTLENGQLSLGLESDAVPLTSVEFREEKARDSLILKLLHKPDNMPQSVYDRVGIRLVLPTKNDAIRALQYIRRHHLANVAHLTPGRSRNTLFDCELRSAPEVDNPHSSPEFRSLQFTCQHLVKLTNPLHTLARRLHEQLPGAELETALAEIQAHTVAPLIRFLFPYEVQILDVENDHKTRFGESSHANYRKRQLRAVRARVFPGWLAHPGRVGGTQPSDM